MDSTACWRPHLSSNEALAGAYSVLRMMAICRGGGGGGERKVVWEMRVRKGCG